MNNLFGSMEEMTKKNLTKEEKNIVITSLEQYKESCMDTVKTSSDSKEVFDNSYEVLKVNNILRKIS